MSMSNFSLNSELSVVCFRRENSKQGPFFAVREFDTKVIRTRDKGRWRGRGPSEQAIRASIRQAILNMILKSERATKAEIRLLKGHGILGKRAPSCSLLCAEDMIKLLEAFGKDDLVRDLRMALAKDKKLSPQAPKSSEEPRSLKNTQKTRKSHSKIKTPPRESGDTLSGKRQRLDSPSRMDALLSALLALSEGSPNLESVSDSPLSSTSSPLSSPELWSNPSSPTKFSESSPPSPFPDSPSPHSHRSHELYSLPDTEVTPKPIPLSSLNTGLSFSTTTPSLKARKSRRSRKTNGQAPSSFPFPLLQSRDIKLDTRRSYLPISHISPPISPVNLISHEGEAYGPIREDSTSSLGLNGLSLQFPFPLSLESLASLSSLDPASFTISPQGLASFQGISDLQGLPAQGLSGLPEAQGFLDPKDQGLTGISQVLLDQCV